MIVTEGTGTEIDVERVNEALTKDRYVHSSEIEQLIKQMEDFANAPPVTQE